MRRCRPELEWTKLILVLFLKDSVSVRIPSSSGTVSPKYSLSRTLPFVFLLLRIYLLSHPICPSIHSLVPSTLRYLSSSLPFATHPTLDTLTSLTHPDRLTPLRVPDSGHPTERVHKLIAEAIEEQLVQASH